MNQKLQFETGDIILIEGGRYDVEIVGIIKATKNINILELSKIYHDIYDGKNSRYEKQDKFVRWLVKEGHAIYVNYERVNLYDITWQKAE
jgi:hypothetical protein